MRQAAAIPYRHLNGSSGGVEVLLVSSSSGRWIIPKGDIDDGTAPHLAAEKEAFEEAGVRGHIGDRSVGSFQTRKEQNGATIPIDVDVFPLEVCEELAEWPESSSRGRRWLPTDQAVEAVNDAGLAQIIRTFRP